MGAGQFLELIRKHLDFKRLTSVMLHELVERIEVYHAEKVGSVRTQRVDIYYSFVGTLVHSRPSKKTTNP